MLVHPMRRRHLGKSPRVNDCIVPAALRMTSRGASLLTGWRPRMRSSVWAATGVFLDAPLGIWPNKGYSCAPWDQGGKPESPVRRSDGLYFAPSSRRFIHLRPFEPPVCTQRLFLQPGSSSSGASFRFSRPFNPRTSTTCAHVHQIVATVCPLQE